MDTTVRCAMKTKWHPPQEEYERRAMGLVMVPVASLVGRGDTPSLL